jgi:hypothetical protein
MRQVWRSGCSPAAARRNERRVASRSSAWTALRNRSSVGETSGVSPIISRQVSVAQIRFAAMSQCQSPMRADTAARSMRSSLSSSEASARRRRRCWSNKAAIRADCATTRIQAATICHL